MKIKLKYPYKKKWKKGYVVTNKENRKMVILFNSHSDRSTTSYARYKLSCKLGRFLTSSEEADHIDDNKRNDSKENLQVLSGIENRRKASVRTYIRLKCIICEIEFDKRKRNTFLQKGVSYTTCGSKTCRHKALSLACRYGTSYMRTLSDKCIIKEFKKKSYKI
jgi:hypothetical protein